MFGLTRRFVATLTACLAAGAGLLPLVAPASSAALAAPVAAASSSPAGGTFTSLAPARLLDTRSNLGGTGPVPAGGVVHLTVLGRGGVPASGVSAVALLVTVASPKASGFVAVWPDGTTRPTASNLSFVANQTALALVVAKVGADGAVALQNSSGGTVQLVADVSGYYLAGTPSVPGAFASLAPARVLDTRSNLGGTGPVPAGGVVHLNVLGRGGVPASGVSAVALLVTVASPKASGFVTAWPDGTTRPTASNLSFEANQTALGLVVAQVGADGAVALRNSSGSTVQLVADVSGYYLSGTPSVAGAFGPLAPSRVLDTRYNLGGTGPVPAGGVVHLNVLGRGGVPTSEVSAVALLVTVASPKASGFVTAWPDGTTRPTASNLSFVANQTALELVVAKVGADGAVALANSSGGTVQLVADVAGYYLSGPPQPVTSVRADNDSATSVGLSWTNPTAGPFTGVVIRRATGATPPPDVNSGDSVPLNTGGATYALDTGLTAGATYSYALFATDGTEYAPPATLTITAGLMTWGTPQTIDPNRGHPLGLSCPTTTFCAAVDLEGEALTWNGATWSAPLRLDPQGRLTAVSCPTASFCVATNMNNNGANVLTYNGSTWSAPTHIDSASDLGSVSCPTTSFCVAVDYDHGSAVTFDGSTWSAPKFVDNNDQLTSVSCPSTSFCAAVDYTGHEVTFDGSTWTTPKLIDSATQLTSVSCPSASFCAAVDYNGNAVTFDGTTWSSPATIDSGRHLRGLSCPVTSSSCRAVDDAGQVLSFTGSGWSAPTSPVFSGGHPSISCLTGSFCAAVDDAGESVTFDGSTWSGPSSFDPYSGYLTGVSCPSATFCAAVDDSGNALSFNGTTWTAPTKVSSGFTSVSCPSATFCAAVDSRGRASTFDGTSWTAPSAIVSPGDLRSVSCPSASFCAATASTGGAVTFNGSTWSALANIDGGKPLMSVSCASASFCVAVDSYGNAVTFNGSAWGTPAAIDGANGSLSSVTCPTAAFCMAVDTSGNLVTYNGSSWSSRVGFDSYVNSISCPTTTFCIALSSHGYARQFNGSDWTYGTIPGEPAQVVSCASAAFCAVVERSHSDATIGTDS